MIDYDLRGKWQTVSSELADLGVSEGGGADGVGHVGEAVV